MLRRLLRRAGVADGSDPPLIETFREIAAELAAGRSWGLAPLKQSATARRLLASSPEEQIEVLVVAVSFPPPYVGGDADHQTAEVCRELANALLRRNLPWGEQSIAALLEALIRSGQRRGRPALIAGGYGDPVNGVLRAVERFTNDRPVPESLHARLRRARELLLNGQWDGAEDRRAARRIDALLGEELESAGPLVSSDDQWAQALLAARDSLDDDIRDAADRMLATAAAARSNKPTKAFLADRARFADELGSACLGEITGALLAAAAATGPSDERGQVPPETGDALRGLCWLAAAGGGDPAVRALGAMALAGWKKVPQHGPMCQKAGNAAIAALADLPEGAPQLGRLRAQLKQPAAVRSVDAAIDEAAQRLGIPRAEFEERVVPHFDLDSDNRRTVALGEHTAELALHADASCTLRFSNQAGRTLKSAPAAVKSDHAEQLAELKQTAKDIKTMAAAQRIRLERLLMDDREWTVQVWHERYLHHGLVGALARRMIWTIDGRGVICPDGRLLTCDGSRLPSPGPNAAVRIWHPVDADPGEVKAWRRFLEDREITQPFKQAHREVYLLTAAEQQTRTYSNRFAAHILRQHQMAALARGRGWRYALQGAWDSADENAVLELPQHHLTVSFWVERPWDTEDWNDSGVFNHVLSDQVRFSDPDGEPLPLETIPTRVLSEVMRDVDLFVGVTSIGNDPTWADQGERRYQDYWRGYAFGELTEQADVRRDLLDRLLPKLVIRDVARLDGRFLRVDGKLRTYKIHLGSGNILMEPNDQYLCIVPGRGRDTAATVFLPFEGDQVLAVILSKAFLLAKDDNIDDPTITSQIKSRR